MLIHLIRHAHAGQRGPGGRDIYRPLSEQGVAEADALATMVDGDAPVLSSPATRCVQTVEPLAVRRGVEVREHHDLWEGSRMGDVIALIRAEATDGLVLCSHGDVIPELIETLAAGGTKIRGRSCEKGSIWTLTMDGDEITEASYQAPPDV